MSRIGKNPVPLQGTEVLLDENYIVVKGPLGRIVQRQNYLVKIVCENDKLIFQPINNSIKSNAMLGTMRSLVANMIIGVTKGFECKLTLIGVGYRAQVQNQQINMLLGFSHPVVHNLSSDIKAEVLTQTEISIKGIDKQVIGQQAAKIRSYRIPDPYKGKGIRYIKESIILKEAKKKK